MSIDKSSDEELRVEEAAADVASWTGEDRNVDDWEVPANVEPCAVYPEGPQALGRITTPLGDLSIANLFGAPATMMRELGRRSAAEVREGALPFLERFCTDAAGAAAPQALSGMGGWIVDHWLMDRMRAAIPESYLGMLRAFAEGSGYDMDQILAAQLAWDVWGLCAQSTSKNLRAVISRARRHSPLFGSASVVLPTEHSGPLHLRWLDNAAVDRWDRKGAVFFLHPDRGLPYALVSSVGFLTGLPAGMNAAGLTVSVEPGAGSSINWRGATLGWPTHQILSRAHTVEEAASIVRQHAPMVPWRYVICEGDTGRCAILEAGETVEAHQLRRRPPFAVAAGDALVADDRFNCVRHWHERRKKALNQLTKRWTAAGEDAVYRALEAMTASGPQGSGHPLSGWSNVSAVVFEPAQRRLWVGAGRAPVARRWFVPLCLRHADGRGTGGGLDSRVRPLSVAGVWEKSHAGRAVDHLRHAYQLDLAGEDDERILITVEHALALDSQRSAHHVLAGLLAIRVGRNRRAEGAFRRALELVEEPARRAELGVYLAWALDRQRRRREARKWYRKIAREPAVERRVRRWARRGRRHRFRRRQIRKMQVDYFLATVFFD